MNKLRNKNTGDIGALNISNNKYQVIEYGMPLCGNSVLDEYDTLDALMQEWEDYKEPERIQGFTNHGEDIIIRMSSIEEAKKAVEKIRALKRLMGKGFKFTGFSEGKIEFKLDEEYSEFTYNGYDEGCELYINSEVNNDLDTLFGREK